MKTATIQEARAAFAEFIAAADVEPIVLTRHGKPVGMLLGQAAVDKAMALSRLQGAMDAVYSRVQPVRRKAVR